jgi:hypothetical protein
MTFRIQLSRHLATGCKTHATLERKDFFFLPLHPTTDNCFCVIAPDGETVEKERETERERERERKKKREREKERERERKKMHVFGVVPHARK